MRVTGVNSGRQTVTFWAQHTHLQSPRPPRWSTFWMSSAQSQLPSSCPKDVGSWGVWAWRSNRSPPPPRVRAASSGWSRLRTRSPTVPKRLRRPGTSRPHAASWRRRRWGGPRPPGCRRSPPSAGSAPSGRSRLFATRPAPAGPWWARAASAGSLQWDARERRRRRNSLRPSKNGQLISRLRHKTPRRPH